MNKLCLLCLTVILAACATKKPLTPVAEDTRPRVILEDGSVCALPDDYEKLVEGGDATRLRDLFQSGASLEERAKSLKELKVGYGTAEAVFFEACQSWAAGALSKAMFEQQRKFYVEVRQKLLADGIQKWLTEGNIKDAGKICLVLVAESPTDARNFTRWVPGDTTVDDCALMASRAGLNEVRLGCTEGTWVNHWAKKTIAAGPWGTKNRKLKIAGTDYAPDPNCAWN